MNTMMETPSVMERWGEALRMYDSINKVPEDRYGTLRLCILLVMIARSYYSDGKWKKFETYGDKILYMGKHATQFIAIAYAMGNDVPRPEGSKPMQLALREMEYWAKWAEEKHTSLLTVRRFTSLDAEHDVWEDVKPAVYLSQMMDSYRTYWKKRRNMDANKNKPESSENHVAQYDPENNPENTNPENEKE